MWRASPSARQGRACPQIHSSRNCVADSPSRSSSESHRGGGAMAIRNPRQLAKRLRQNAVDCEKATSNDLRSEHCTLLLRTAGALPHARRQDRRTWGEMGGGHEIFRTHSLGVAETQSLPEAHGAGRLADPLNPAPGRLMVVRNCVALDTLDQVSSLASVSGYCFGHASKCSVASWANC